MEAFISDQKKNLRSDFLKKRNCISKLEYENLNKNLNKTATHFLSSAHFSKIFLFHPLSNEPDLRPLIDLDFFHGKKFGLPVLVSKEKMSFFEWTKKFTLKKNHFGILEPDPFFATALNCRYFRFIFMETFSACKEILRRGRHCHSWIYSLNMSGLFLPWI